MTKTLTIKTNTMTDCGKLGKVFGMLDVAYSKCYKPSEHLANDEVTVLFKGRVAFKQDNQKKRKTFGINIFKFR
jgi:hypothetical protein